MQLREIMNTRVVTIGADDTASAAWTRMRRRDIRHLVVTDQSRLAGMLSERDLGGRTGTALRRGRKVRDLMARSIVGATPDMTVREAADLMRERLIGSLPILEDGELVGIVTATDVFDALAADRQRPLTRAERQLLRAPTSSRKLGGTPAPHTRSATRAKAGATRAEPRTRAKRASVVVASPGSTDRGAGRGQELDAPVHIRAMGIQVSPEDREYMRGKLDRRLAKFSDSIERVSVRVRDVNGPRGGVDRECQIKVVVAGLPSVVFEAQDADLRAAADAALTGVQRALRRTVERRRTKPIRSA
jgi:CBS domain-containing protein/ribosome-associated translation inhibitor RaiA